MRLPLLIAAIALAVTGAHAADTPYAGQDQRSIASLSDEDVAELSAGAGWGLAKPAELNGWPGPRHVLDLSAKLGLTDEQSGRIEAIYAAMNSRAKELGHELIARERALDEAFESGDIDGERLGRLLADAEATRAELRRVHLEAHIETTPLLTMHQKVTYQQLRGYGGHDGHGGHN